MRIKFEAHFVFVSINAFRFSQPSRFVLRDLLLPVSVDMILFFYIADGNVKAVMTDGKEYLFTQTLDELADSLDPALFFRINRQYLISRKAVQDIDLWFNGRLAINLIVPTLDRILVSKARVPDFKTWFTS